MPTPDILGQWLGRPITDDERGSDLRQLLRGEKHALEEGEENEEELTIAKQIAHHTLFEEIDIYEEIIAETKDINLASLLVHQNLLSRLDPKATLDQYATLMRIILFGDRCDFWAFFHQCWPLLAISLEFKCKLLNLHLCQIPKPICKKQPTIEQLEYTWVLTKQSSLFNAWKEICIQYDTNHIPIHYVCDLMQSSSPKLQFTEVPAPDSAL